MSTNRHTALVKRNPIIIWGLILVIQLTLLWSVHSHSDVQGWIDEVSQVYGEKAAQRVIAWRQTIQQAKRVQTKQRLVSINQFFNQLRFVDDLQLWGKYDYWATPLEFLGAGAGDCEDFTIAKYFSLREVGIPDKKLRLVYVKAIKLNQFHMVLAYYETPNAEPLILDNLVAKIQPASARTDLLPIYSFNGRNLWLMKSKTAQLAGEASRLSLWNDLRHRNQTIILKKPLISYDG